MEQSYGLIEVDYVGRLVIPAKLRKDICTGYKIQFELLVDGIRTVLYAKIDSSGRLVIPAKLRDEMQFKLGTLFEVLADAGRIILVKRTMSCVICGAVDVEFKERNGKHICLKCCDSL